MMNRCENSKKTLIDSIFKSIASKWINEKIFQCFIISFFHFLGFQGTHFGQLRIYINFPQMLCSLSLFNVRYGDLFSFQFSFQQQQEEENNNNNDENFSVHFALIYNLYFLCFALYSIPYFVAKQFFSHS